MERSYIVPWPGTCHGILSDACGGRVMATAQAETWQGRLVRCGHEARNSQSALCRYDQSVRELDRRVRNCLRQRSARHRRHRGSRTWFFTCPPTSSIAAIARICEHVETGRIATVTVNILEYLPRRSPRQPFRVLVADDSGRNGSGVFHRAYGRQDENQAAAEVATRFCRARSIALPTRLQMVHPDYVSDARR